MGLWRSSGGTARSIIGVALGCAMLGGCSEKSNDNASAGGSGGSGSGGTGNTTGSGGSSTAGNGGQAGGPMRCNGHEALCDRRFDEVVYPATHNSMSNADEGWGIPNQVHGMTRQLEDGIRAMLIDTHYNEGSTYLCHSFCSLGSKPLVDGLAELTTFLKSHPNEVLTLIIQDGITPEDTSAAFTASGLSDHVYVHPTGAEWPTLRTMIETGKRVLVTAEDKGPPPDWYHHVWDLTWDTPYSFKSEAEFSCAENRGKRGNDLFLLNHWIENPLANEELSTTANARDLLLGRAQQCQQESGQLPNFVAVNHYSIGALFDVVRELNRL